MGYRRYSPEEYQRAMRLLKKGLGLTTVSRLTGIPKTTLYYWRHNLSRPPSTRWRPKPSKELAYALGALHGDANLHIQGSHHEIELSVKDHSFAETFSRNLAKTLEKPIKKPTYRRDRRQWRVYYKSKAFSIWYQKQTLQTLKPYIEHDKDTVKQYLKALYDSEGSNYRCLTITLSNSNLDLLHYVQYLLKKYFNIIATGPYICSRPGKKVKIDRWTGTIRKNVYIIAIARKTHVKRFLNEIGFSIKEKQLGKPRRIRGSSPAH